MPSKLVIALALSPAAALQLPGVGEVALKLPHRSSVLRDAISQFAAAQSALEAVFRPPPPREATHSISDVRKREIQEGRARPRRALARTKIPADLCEGTHARARAVAAAISSRTQVCARAAVDQGPEGRGHRLCGGGATEPALGAPGRRRRRRRGPRALRRGVVAVPDRRPRGRRVQGPGHRPGRHRQGRLPGGRRAVHKSNFAALLNHDLHAIDHPTH